MLKKIAKNKPSECARCGVMFDWTDGETLDYIKEIGDELYCYDCGCEIEARGEIQADRDI